MRIEHHLVGGYVHYISPYIIIIIISYINAIPFSTHPTFITWTWYTSTIAYATSM